MSGIGNVGGNQPIENKSVQQGGLKRTDVAEEYRSIFDKFDKNGDQVLNENDGANAISNFWSAVKNFFSSKTQKAEPSATTADVKSATNSPVNNEEQTKFDGKGNVIPEVTHNSDGSTTTKHGGETITAKDGKIHVVDANGKSAGGIQQLPNGLQVLKQPDGTEGVYDPKKGEFLPEKDAQEILAQFGEWI